MSNKIKALVLDMASGLVGGYLAFYFMTPSPNQYDAVYLVVYMAVLRYIALFFQFVYQPRPVKNDSEPVEFLDYWSGGFITGFTHFLFLFWAIKFLNRPGVLTWPHPDSSIPTIEDFLGEGLWVGGVYIDTFVLYVVTLFALVLWTANRLSENMPTEADMYRFYLRLKERRLERLNGGTHAR